MSTYDKCFVSDCDCCVILHKPKKPHTYTAHTYYKMYASTHRLLHHRKNWARVRKKRFMVSNLYHLCLCLVIVCVLSGSILRNSYFSMTYLHFDKRYQDLSVSYITNYHGEPLVLQSRKNRIILKYWDDSVRISVFMGQSRAFI